MTSNCFLRYAALFTVYLLLLKLINFNYMPNGEIKKYTVLTSNTGVLNSRNINHTTFRIVFVVSKINSVSLFNLARDQYPVII